MNNEAQEITLEDILHIFKKRIGWFILAVVSAVVLTLIYILLATPIYEATVTIKINPSYESGISTLFTNVQGYSSRPDISTEVEISKSRTVLERAIRSVGPDRLVERKDEDLEIDMTKLVTMVSKWMSVEPVKDTRIIRLSIQHKDPVLAADLANAISIAYNERLKELSQNEFTLRRTFIEQQIPSAEKRLKEAQEKLKEFKEKNQVFVLSEEAKNILSSLSQYDSQYNKLTLDLQELSTKIKILRDTLKTVDQKIVSSEVITSNPIIEQLRVKLADLQVELAGLLQSYSENDKRVIAVKTKINETEELIKKEVEKVVSSQTQIINPIYTQTVTELMDNESRYQVVNATMKALEKIREQYQAKMQALPLLEQQLLEFERNVSVQEGIYTLLLQKLEEARISEAGVSGNAQIVDPATTPRIPVKPNKKLTLAIGGVLGLFIGILLVFLVEYLDKTLRGEDEIKRIIGAEIPILGRIPEYEFNSKEYSELVVRDKPTSPVSESFKLASTNITFSKDIPPKVVTVTSPGPEEGKTFVAVNLALSFAQSGVKTILVDIDLRKPRVEKALGLDSRSKFGITNIIFQNRALDEFIIQFDENLDVLPVGPLPPNPTILFTSRRFEDLMKTLRERYEKVIIDLPPILAAADPLLVSKQSDGIVLVARAGKTMRNSLRFAYDNIKTSGNVLLGVIINSITEKLSSAYYYYYYYYYYTEDGEKIRKKRRKSVKKTNNN